MKLWLFIFTPLHKEFFFIKIPRIKIICLPLNRCYVAYIVYAWVYIRNTKNIDKTPDLKLCWDQSKPNRMWMRLEVKTKELKLERCWKSFGRSGICCSSAGPRPGLARGGCGWKRYFGFGGLSGLLGNGSTKMHGLKVKCSLVWHRTMLW